MLSVPGSSRPSFLPAFSALAALAAFTGCGIGPSPISATANNAGLAGVAHGGQQPIAGATVRLLIPGHTGYGSAPTVLASTSTNSAGQFTLPAYVCPAGIGLVYLQVDGGDAGAGPNTRISEAAVLGDCSSLTPTTFVVVSEVTTIAAAYTLSPFAALDATSGVLIGTSATNATGLNNAFGAANNLADFHTGNARAANAVAGLVLPTAEMNTLGDILAACVNSSGSVTGTTPCSTLLTATGLASTSAAANTFGAATAIALSPGTSVATLFGLSTANPPFQPTLASAPADFAVAIEYNGAGIDASGGTTGLAIDAAGNAWISTGYNPSSNPGTHAVTVISPAGSYLSGATGFGSANITAPFGIAIDATGNAVVADAYGNRLVKLSTSGALLATGTAPSFHNPNGLAIAADTSIFVTSANGAQVSRVDGSTFAELVGSPYNTGSFGAGVAANATSVWSANYVANSISRINLTNNTVSTFATTSTPSAMILDAGGNAWTTLVHTVAKYSNSGGLQTNASSGAFATNNTTHIPQDIAIDGFNRAWVSNYRGYPNSGSLILLANDGTLLSPNDGFTANGAIISGPSVPDGIAVDASGNVWIAGYTVANANAANSQTGNFVSEVIGIAAPVRTPRVVQLTTGTIGTRP